MTQRREQTSSTYIRSLDPPGETEHIEEVQFDPYAERRAKVHKVNQWIYLVFGVLESLIAIRFTLLLLGANPNAAFATFIYGVTEPFIAPFAGLFRVLDFETGTWEPESLVALLVYFLLSLLLVKLVWILWGETRTGITTSRRVDAKAAGDYQRSVTDVHREREEAS